MSEESREFTRGEIDRFVDDVCAANGLRLPYWSVQIEGGTLWVVIVGTDSEDEHQTIRRALVEMKPT